MPTDQWLIDARHEPDSEAWNPGPTGYAWAAFRDAPWRLVWRNDEGTTWLIEWTFGGETTAIDTGVSVQFGSDLVRNKPLFPAVVVVTNGDGAWGWQLLYSRMAAPEHAFAEGVFMEPEAGDAG